MDVYDKPLFRGGVLLPEMSAPSVPSGAMAVFVGTDGYLYAKNDAGDVFGIRPAPQYADSVVALQNLSTSYSTFAGAPSIGVNVPNSGRLLITVAVRGAHATAGSSIRLAVSMSGANTITPSGSTGDTGGVTIIGGGSGTRHDAGMRTTLHTGLNPGFTTVSVYARTSNSTGETLEEASLLVQAIP